MVAAHCINRYSHKDPSLILNFLKTGSRKSELFLLFFYLDDFLSVISAASEAYMMRKDGLFAFGIGAGSYRFRRFDSLRPDGSVASVPRFTMLVFWIRHNSLSCQNKF
jgi:hypothetical protein